jgi:hypothetical protein
VRGRALLVVLGAVVLLVTGVPVAQAASRPPARPQPLVLLYGDSLVWEAKPYAEELLHRVARVQAVVVGAPGKAPCDLLGRMREDAARLRPTAVVLSFSGNAMSPCMHHNGRAVEGDEWLARYWRATADAVGIFRRTGAQVWLGTQPISLLNEKREEPENARLNAMYRWLAALVPGVHIAESADTVLDRGHWSRTMPCTRYEPCTATPDVHRRIWNNVVRAPDGGHFCPVAYAVVNNCPVYASGAMRFAAGLLFPTLRDQGLLPDARLRGTKFFGAA